MTGYVRKIIVNRLSPDERFIMIGYLNPCAPPNPNAAIVRIGCRLKII